MGLLTKERALIENNYFQVWDVVNLLYEAQLLEEKSNFFERSIFNTWHEVGSYLGYHSFDRKLQLFIKDEYYNVIPYEFYPPYQPISNLIQRLKVEWLIGDEKSIKIIEEEVSCYYWLKKDIYNFKPIADLNIIDLDIIERSFFELSPEVSQPDKATKSETDLKEEIEQLKNQLQKKKIEIEKLKAAQHENVALLPEAKYTTPSLEALKGVINEFWIDYDPDKNQPTPKQNVVANWTMANYPDVQGKELCIYIDKICRHPNAKKGGNIKLKLQNTVKDTTPIKF